VGKEFDVWIIAGLLGLATVLSGALPWHDTVHVLGRVAPVLAFLASISALAELSERAEVFDVAATHTARWGGGRTFRLFLLVGGLATATTILLSLDTTAVLLTPVVLALAGRLDLRAIPFALLVVWLANTASLLLPVSNLTNLLAVDRLNLSTLEFAARMALPELFAVAVTIGYLAAIHRHDLRGRYPIPAVHRPADPTLAAVCGALCVLTGLAVLAGAPPWAASLTAAAVAAGVTAVRSGLSSLAVGLIPWRLLVLTTGLFLTVSAIGQHGLDTLLRHALGTGGELRAAGVAAGLSNMANNLPSYLALERAVPPDHQDQLLAVLTGVNIGPLVLLWGSLATLLWRERCKARGVQISTARFALTGLGGMPLVLLSAVLALHLT
jgi:arsenical pump membrane protein